eukprot:scaffold625_cov420-Prasinococcus_capsulatus_cf.AAC.47
MTTIGVITSIFPIFYGFSKFVSGVVSTKVSAQFMLGGGLMLTGIICTGMASRTPDVWGLLVPCLIPDV